MKVLELRKDGAALPLVNTSMMYLASHHTNRASTPGLFQVSSILYTAYIVTTVFLFWPYLDPLCEWLTCSWTLKQWDDITRVVASDSKTLLLSSFLRDSLYLSAKFDIGRRLADITESAQQTITRKGQSEILVYSFFVFCILLHLYSVVFREITAGLNVLPFSFGASCDRI